MDMRQLLLALALLAITSGLSAQRLVPLEYNDALPATDRPLKELFKLYGATWLVTLLKLELPSALPQIFVGLKVAAGLAVVGTIVGEFIAGGGLGGLIDVARTRQRVDQVFAAILLATVIGLIFVSSIHILRSRALSAWHVSLKNS